MMSEETALEKKADDKIQTQNLNIARLTWQNKLTKLQKEMLWNICQELNLNPLTKPIIILGDNLYVTRDGISQIAAKSDDPPGSIILEPATQEERDLAGVPKGVQGFHYWKCTIMTTKERGPFVEFGEADSKNVHLKNAGWREHQDMAKTRAYNRAMKLAYNIGMTSSEEIPQMGGGQKKKDEVIDVEATEVSIDDKDPFENPPEVPEKPRTRARKDEPTKAMWGLMHNICSHDEIHAYALSLGHESSKQLTREQAQKLIDKTERGDDGAYNLDSDEADADPAEGVERAPEAAEGVDDDKEKAVVIARIKKRDIDMNDYYKIRATFDIDHKSALADNSLDQLIALDDALAVAERELSGEGKELE